MDGPASTEDDSPSNSIWNRWSRFAAQRLKAYQPLLAPRPIIGCYIGFGLAFLTCGTVLTLAQSGVQEHLVDYTDTAVNHHNVGTFDIRIEEDMEAPIWVYYQLDGFHQNHRRYIKSRSHAQLKEGNGPAKTSEQDYPECYPWITTDGRVNYPCGVVARSVFNDSFVVTAKTNQDGAWSRLNIDSSAETIGWPGDVGAGKFSNLDPHGTCDQGVPNQVAVNMWIHQLFPPVTCEQVSISESSPYVPVTVAMTNITVPAATGNGQGSRHAPDCWDYSGKPKCNFMRAGQSFNCSGNYREVRQHDWGIESGHFINWMRVAGLPRFMKLWGRINTDVKAGTTLRIHFVDNFPVKPFHARKAFVLSTASALGGQNDFLGIGYLAVGGGCLVFGLAFLWRHIAKPRALGDVSLLYAMSRREHETTK